MLNPLQLFKYCYESSDDVAREIALDVNKCISERNVTRDVVEEIELCITELVNNAYEHAYEFTDGRPIEVACYLKNNTELVISVSDYGKAMDRNDFEAAINADFVVPQFDEPDTWATSGRGFIIIVRLANTLNYTSCDDKNTFEFHKKM